MTKRTVIGIDPGITGGVAVINDSGIKTYQMPSIKAGSKNEIDIMMLCNIMNEARIADMPNEPIVIIEKVHAMPKNGAVSMFNFGMGFGALQGLCAGLGLSYQLVTPQSWQRHMLDGCGRGKGPKASSGVGYQVASRLWPGHEFRASSRCKNAHEGMVDAALIAEYGRRMA